MNEADKHLDYPYGCLRCPARYRSYRGFMDHKCPNKPIQFAKYV